MRESTSSGGQAAWASTGTNTLTVRMKVLKVGNNGSVCIGQVFNGTDSITLGELQYNGSSHRLEMFYEEAKGKGEPMADTGVSVALNTEFTYELALSAGTLTAKINGKQVYSRRPTASTLKKKFYFKYGAYDQSATKGTPTTAVFTQVSVYSASLTHG